MSDGQSKSGWSKNVLQEFQAGSLNNDTTLALFPIFKSKAQRPIKASSSKDLDKENVQPIIIDLTIDDGVSLETANNSNRIQYGLRSNSKIETKEILCSNAIKITTDNDDLYEI